MRRYRWLDCLAFSVLLMAACKKSSTESIVGSWELRKSEGGLAGTSTYPPGNGNIVQFTDAGGYRRFNADTLFLTGTYSISNASGPAWVGIPFDHLLSIHYDGSNNIPAQTVRDSVRIAGNQLIFIPPSYAGDIPTVFYVRMN